MPSLPSLPSGAARARVLRRHGLLGAGSVDVAGTGAASARVVDLARRAAGLHATAAATPYLSLAARLSGFALDELDRQLYETRSLLRLRCMRGTIFVMPRDLARVAIAATHGPAVALSHRYMVGMGLSEADHALWSERVLAVLRKEGPLTARELRERLRPPIYLPPIINLMGDELLLLRDRPAGGWRDLQFRYIPAEDVWPRAEWESLDPQAATAQLVRAYLQAFGPATLEDIAWWTGFPRRTVAGAVRALAGETVELLVSGEGTGGPGGRKAGSPGEPTRLMLAADYAAATAATASEAAGGRDPVAPDGRPGPVHLLPTLDPLVMGYHDRRHYLREEYRDLAFDMAGNGTSTILYRGEVAGVWDALTDPEPAVAVLVFPGYPAAEILAAVQDPAREVSRLLFGQDAPLVVKETMRPLTEPRTGG